MRASNENDGGMAKKSLARIFETYRVCRFIADSQYKRVNFDPWRTSPDTGVRHFPPNVASRWRRLKSLSVVGDLPVAYRNDHRRHHRGDQGTASRQRSMATIPNCRAWTVGRHTGELLDLQRAGACLDEILHGGLLLHHHARAAPPRAHPGSPGAAAQHLDPHRPAFNRT
jgi:hypothetical protein